MIYQPIENTGEYTTGTVYSEGYVKSLEQEIERLTAESTKYESKFYDEAKENERLHSIIKEVREYIEKHLEREYFNYDILEANTIYNRDLYKVLKILDKESE